MKEPSSRNKGNEGAQVQPGLYGYTQEGNGDRSQIHLRVEADGHGLLLINANRAIHLNPTATLMAWLFLEGVPQKAAINALRKHFHVSGRTAKNDYQTVRDQIEQLIHPDGVCPVHDLELDLLPPFSEIPSAPYRMDLALTYRCNANCSHCYNSRSRDYPEISTDQWKTVIDKLWLTGVPHICFTGGESTLRNDLPDLIAHAKSTGQISGLLTNGIRLSDRNYMMSLVRAGLDHVQITIESHIPTVHDQMVGAPGAWEKTVQGIRNCLESEVFVMTNTTLLASNISPIGETIDFLAELGVPTVGCNALIYSGKGRSVGTGIQEHELGPILETVRQHTTANGQRLIWYTPTQYCHFDPVQMQLGVKGCSAARYNMCIEPNGDVIPCQSFYQTVGNILQDPWDEIWNHDLSLWLREREYVPEECQRCAMLNECGGGCPLTLMHQPDQIPINQVQLPDSTS
ncbi:MAG: radical SAM protein [Anaerolineaceae bacterium]|nr:MAG: radical SAM protein [Anaerolineaceae bacterium]